MKTRFASLLLSVLAACAGQTSDGDLPIGDATGADLGKADHTGLTLTALSSAVDAARLERGGRAFITSADSWEAYFGTPAPTEVDFDREWVAFYGAGLKNHGGFSARVGGVHVLEDGGLLLATSLESPGVDCLVTQALTTPYALVKFAIPDPVPTWAVGDHESTTEDCSPSADDRAAQLATSLSAWQQGKAVHGGNYTYSQVMASFIGFEAETTFVVRNDVVVERSYQSSLGDQVDSWTETGTDVGSHTDEGHPLALVEDLYQTCADDVLTVDEQEHFINLGFDDAGLLRVCTSFHKLCNDDCDQGPKIGFIRFD